MAFEMVPIFTPRFEGPVAIGVVKNCDAQLSLLLLCILRRLTGRTLMQAHYLSDARNRRVAWVGDAEIV